MVFLADYASFLAKAITVVVAVIVLLVFVMGMRRGQASAGKGYLSVHCLNDDYEDMQEQIEQVVLNKKQMKKLRKEKAAAAKKAKEVEERRPRVFVLHFEGDMKASAVAGLRQEVTALLTQASAKEDEVVVCLESGGGVVHGYGLAASQLARVREAGVPLTVCVDKVAASGGYMMACIADKILAAPFAILGSIGVVAQLPNFNRLLRKHDVDYEMLTAGEYKRTLTLFGENTDKGREKFQEDLELTHNLFKDFVSRNRPQVDIDLVATGEAWLGTTALKKKLVDQLQTSDQYLTERAREADLFLLRFVEKKSLQERIGLGLSATLEHGLTGTLEKLNLLRFWR